jgi:LmbE family N-acetylglucosaminyl deacetylase
MTLTGPILAVGAHPDDVELGCAATLAAHPGSTIITATLGGARGTIDTRRTEATAAAADLGASWACLGFDDLAVPAGHELSRAVELLAFQALPAVVLTHWPDDTHPDHRAVALAVAAACRPGAVTPHGLQLAYFEGISSRRFTPDWYVTTTTADLATATIALGRYRSQLDGPVDIGGYLARAAWRGSQVRTPAADAYAIGRLITTSHGTP